jgi:lipopolysaccharide biosynthesis glycosyltransferase
VRNVVYACDNHYVRQTIVSVVSLLENNKYPIKVWIVSDGIKMENIELIIEKTRKFHIELEFLDIEKILEDVILVGGERHPRTIYAKLFLEDAIRADKLLYLDSDTVINCDLSELWIRDMSEELIAGVMMPYSAIKKGLMDISSKASYLCDGIVLLNLDLWREYKISNKCKEYIQRYMGKPPMMSEGTLNYICQQKIGVLPPRYNLMSFMIMYSSKKIRKLFETKDYYTELELDEARNFPAIIHFIKELYNRPWFDPCDHPYKTMYREKYESLFPNGEYEFNPLENHTRFTRLLFHILPFGVYTFLYHLKERVVRNYDKKSIYKRLP